MSNNSFKYFCSVMLGGVLALGCTATSHAQLRSVNGESFYYSKYTVSENYPTKNHVTPSPTGALLRSFVIPGWGHFYAGTEHKNRALIHLGSDIALLGSYFGIRIHANNIENNAYTFARQHAGIDLKNRSREFVLNVGEYGSLGDYNDFQERSRNWDRIYQTNPQNYWNWDTDQNRLSFLRMDTRVQDNRQQLPAIISLMVVNRLVAGISAFSRARQQQQPLGTLSFTGADFGGNRYTVLARYHVSF